MLRWGGYSEKVGEGMVRFFVRLFRGKASLLLLAVALLALLGSANDKWRP